jgi:hypothetical protein
MTMKIELDRTERPNCFELWRAERRAIKLLYVIGDEQMNTRESWCFVGYSPPGAPPTSGDVRPAQ